MNPSPTLDAGLVAAPDTRAPARRLQIDRPTAFALALAAAGLPFRLLFVALLHSPARYDTSDMYWYHRSALHFLDASRAVDHFDWYYPTGTPAMIALFLKLFGPVAGVTALALAQATLVSTEVPLVYVIGRRWFGPNVGLAASALYALHYLPLGFAGMFMSESWLTIGLVAALALLDPEKPGRALLAGLMLGFGAWAKSQAVLLAPLWALLMVWRWRRWGSAAALVAGTVAVVLPMSILASKKVGRPVMLSPNGGQTFALGQCPIKSISYNDPKHHEGANFGLPDLFQRVPRGEQEAFWEDAHYDVPFFDSGFYFREGLRCIRRYRYHALRAVFLHLADTFAGPPWSMVAPWPLTITRFNGLVVASNLVIAYLVAPLAFLGLWLRRREAAMWLVFGLPVLSLLASALLFHGDPRFRVPYDFAFILAACSAVQHLVNGRRAKAMAAAAVGEGVPAQIASECVSSGRGL